VISGIFQGTFNTSHHFNTSCTKFKRSKAQPFNNDQIYAFGCRPAEIHENAALFASLSPKHFAKINMRSLVVLFYAAGGVGQLLDNFPAENIRISR
jgi:hypothetical protein